MKNMKNQYIKKKLLYLAMDNFIQEMFLVIMKQNIDIKQLIIQNGEGLIEEVEDSMEYQEVKVVNMRKKI